MMARIYGQTGCLTQLTQLLRASGIEGFETLDSIRRFRNGYQGALQKIRKTSRARLLQDIASLESDYEELSCDLNNRIEEREARLRAELSMLRTRLNTIDDSGNLLGRIVAYVKRWMVSRRASVLERSFRREAEKPFRRSLDDLVSIQSNIDDKKNNKEKWIDAYSYDDTKQQERILSVFQANRWLFYGAVGEERALHELSKLPDSYTVINDFKSRFGRPIYNRREDDRIHSVQIDHIVIGPTGIYLVETKNWSRASVESRDLFSPVKQVNRQNFAMFVLLNDAVRTGMMRRAFSGNWGYRKISPKNIILLMNHKPREKYQHVQILSPEELVRYISSGTPMFTETEVDALADYMLQPGLHS